MIQRIQTVYLFLIIALCTHSLFLSPVKYVVGADIVAEMGNFSFTTMGEYAQMGTSVPWCLGTLLILIILISAVTIMLFRKRMRQLRLAIFSSILLVGYIAVAAVFACKFQLQLEDFVQGNEPQLQIGIAAIHPVICFILNCLAIHGIRKDEALVRSLDRLR